VKSAAFLALAAAAGLAAAQPEDWGDFDAEWANNPEYESSKGLCRGLRDREPPVSDRPTPAQAAELRGCSSEDLYYGIGMPADPERARLCAFVEADEAPGHAFSGRAMLMTIYANGRGARRDLDVAIHLACGIDGAPAESHGRVTHLAELRDRGWSGSNFHYCDDITSGLSGGSCAGHAAAVAGARREAELARISAGWAADARRSFAALRETFDAYAEAHASGETNLSGTLRVALQVGAEERLRDQFLEMIRLLEAGDAPAFSAQQMRMADAVLNSAYRQALRANRGGGAEAVGPDGIRDAQRAWLRYRDAFLAFAAIRYPNARRHSLAAWLTRQRNELLRDLRD
jgi:uncharacterized protein YecT (DUF1311 family)